MRIDGIKDLEKKTGRPFTGMYVVLPDENTISAEVMEIYNIIHNHGRINYKAYEVSSAFTRLQAEVVKNMGLQELDIAWIGSLIYAAGKLEGIRTERARRKKKA